MRDIPEKFDREISAELVNYSAEICKMRSGDPKTFQSLGSGTLVQKENKFGILTAHHCLHYNDSEESQGIGDNETLICMAKGGRSIVVESNELREIELAFPQNKTYMEYGPDLTFIEILSESRLSTFKAVSSFWNLDREPTELEREFGKPGHIMVNAGFPGVDQKTSTTNEAISHESVFKSFINVMTGHEVEMKPPWDFINSTCNYKFAKDAPQTFGGISGGGIWSIRVKHEKDSNEYSVSDFALIGVNFWQTGIKNEKQDIRGHYIGSIYETAWL